MKFINLYEYLDFCIPIEVKQMYPNKMLYVGRLSLAPMTLANIEIYLVSFDLRKNRFVIYYEGDKE